MEKEIPAVVPILKLKPLESEPTTTTTFPTTTENHIQAIVFPDTRRKRDS